MDSEVQAHRELAAATELAEIGAIARRAARQLTEAQGATFVVRDGNVGQQLLDIGGTDVIVSTTIDSADVGSVLRGLRMRGSYVLTGMTVEPLSLMPAGFAFAQQRVIGSVIGTRREQAELLDLAVRHHIRPMTESYALGDANAVHDRLRNQKVRMRAVLLPT